MFLEEKTTSDKMSMDTYKFYCTIVSVVLALVDLVRADKTWFDVLSDIARYSSWMYISLACRPDSLSYIFRLFFFFYLSIELLLYIRTKV